MPRLSVYFIRASLVYMIAGFTLGSLMLANKGLMISPAIWALLPIHMEFTLMGWMVQFAMGVAFWILPRFSRGPARGNEHLSWLAFVCFNTGIVLVALDGLPGWQLLSFPGRVLEAAALVLFTVGHWTRIKAHGVN